MTIKLINLHVQLLIILKIDKKQFKNNLTINIDIFLIYVHDNI